MNSIHQVHCLSLPQSLHWGFTVDFSTRLFQTILEQKAHCLSAFSEEIEADAAAVQTSEDLAAFISGSVLNSLWQGSFRYLRSEVWSDVSRINAVFAVRDPDKSGLSAHQLAWVLARSNGGLITPAALIFPVFKRILKRLDASSAAQLNEDTVWRELTNSVQAEITSILSPHPMHFETTSPILTYSYLLLKILRKIYMKAVARRLTGNFLAKESGKRGRGEDPDEDPASSSSFRQTLRRRLQDD